uniref:Predicted protein n=1 Tax=Hordeum vulgare subsp. vulgare TaxID=112509 RepID=F2DGJ5_HORVV|nr:predicted protein [Hordeum vulgare subsp. vulgare]BAK00923.1 predicted protein [Hordeum vulgare subsp. vulgare]
MHAHMRFYAVHLLSGSYSPSTPILFSLLATHDPLHTIFDFYLLTRGLYLLHSA